MDFTPPPDTGRGPSVTTDWEGFGDFSDFFGSIFGRPSGGRAGAGRAGADRAGVRMPIPGNDVEGELPLTLDDVLHGGQRRITVDGRSLDVTIPRGIRDGATLRLAGQGGPASTAARRATCTCASGCCRTRATAWSTTIWRWTCRSGRGRRCSAPRCGWTHPTGR